MKGKTLLVLAAVAAGGAFLYFRSRGTVLGVTEGSGFQKGAVSGQMYPIGIGEPGTGGTLHSVFSPDDASLLLFTFVVTPTGNSLGPVNPEAPPEAVQLGLQDFGFQAAA